MKPNRGRIVHYVKPDGHHSVAIVTRVDADESANLTVFNDSTEDGPDAPPVARLLSVSHDEEKLNCTWHWPEREAADIPMTETKQKEGIFVEAIITSMKCPGAGCHAHMFTVEFEDKTPCCTCWNKSCEHYGKYWKFPTLHLESYDAPSTNAT